MAWRAKRGAASRAWREPLAMGKRTDGRWLAFGNTKPTHKKTATGQSRPGGMTKSPLGETTNRKQKLRKAKPRRKGPKDQTTPAAPKNDL